MQPLLPGSTLGVLGGGQLGRMFVHQAQAMGYFTAVLDADPTSPAGLVSHHHIQTGYEDPQGLAADLTAMLQGMSVQAGAGASPKELEQLVDIDDAIQTLERVVVQIAQQQIAGPIRLHGLIMSV